MSLTPPRPLEGVVYDIANRRARKKKFSWTRADTVKGRTCRELVCMASHCTVDVALAGTVDSPWALVDLRNHTRTPFSK